MQHQIIDRDQTADRDRIEIAIILGQLLQDALTTPSYVGLVVDEVGLRWQQRLREHEISRQLLAEMDPLPGDGTHRWRAERTDLHRFVDEFTFAVEGRQDVPDAVRAQIWRAYAQSLAPAGHPVHEVTENPGC
jgi:hypothetical protein